MKRIALLIGLVVLAAAAAYFGYSNRPADLAVLNARAIPVKGDDGMFMVTLEIKNAGEPKTLTAISSSAARGVHIMNPQHGKSPIVIPAKSAGIFAMDGAHIMFMGVGDDFEEGSFVPLTLSFSGGSNVNARVLIAGGGMGGMDHSMMAGIQSDESPTVSISAKEAVTAKGADISIEVENFRFVRVEDGAPHTPNEGHAHIYLNGLKLGRLYDTDFSLGALSKGTYDLTVSLNSNDHRPYLNEGKVVQDTLSFVIE